MVVFQDQTWRRYRLPRSLSQHRQLLTDTLFRLAASLMDILLLNLDIHKPALEANM